MANKNNATCSICGKEYYACLSCRDSLRANPWKIHTDTAEHYKVYQIIHGLSTGVYTKEEAKVKLKNVDLSDLNNFRPHIKKIIKDVLKENKPVVKITEKVKPVVEVIKPAEVKVTIEEDNTVVENIQEVTMPTVSRKEDCEVEAD